MYDYGWNEADQARHNLEDLISGIGQGLGGAADAVRSAIDGMIHSAAVGLLHSVLPPIVHAKNATTKVTGWASIQALTAEAAFTVTGARVHNAVLAGEVGKKVEQGIGHITANIDYAGGVNSIT